MAKTNTISTAPVNEWTHETPGVCASISRSMFDEVLEQDNRLYVLAEQVRGELKSVKTEREPESSQVSIALCLVELLCDLMSDRTTQYRLQDCLTALHCKLSNGAEKIAA